MHPRNHALATPDKAAIIDSKTGAATSYAALDAASNRAAHTYRSLGLAVGDVIAIMADNHAGYYALTWGAQRAGLFYVCISTKLTQDEIDYILADSGAKLLIAGASLARCAETLTSDVMRYATGGPITGFADWDAAAAAMPDTPIADERAGTDMLYSSGTTGRPKGVRVALPDDGAIDAEYRLSVIGRMIGLGPDSIYLSPAPLYHAAPLRWSMTIHRLGGTVVLMPHFDPEAALAAIDRFSCNASQWVPTHFIRMLKLPDDVRLKYDMSSMRCAIHAAAPCPVPVKRAMIDWWGPVIIEYYAGSEGNGLTLVGSKDWLERPGTVGRSVHGIVHVCDDHGDEVPPRTEGLIYYEGGSEFEYHNDPVKTAEARNKHGWSTLGDIGWVDEDGFLFLTDRKSCMIISGGVNIYPQEIENHLITHPRVRDVAVIGGPHEEMGEEVLAVVQPLDMQDATGDAADVLRADLIAFAREKLSGVKVPRRIDFMAELPRHDTGKLYKRLLRDQYWAKGAAPAAPTLEGHDA